MTLNQNGTSLPSHPDRLKTNGIDATTGSLGQGISIAAGIALSHQLRSMPNRTFCIAGNGELNEGQCWEAFQFIAHRKLTNLTIIIDYNKQQLDGDLVDIINPFDLNAKFTAFGFQVAEVQATDIGKLVSTLSSRQQNMPLVVILHSKKGQGIDYLEAQKNCHHLRLNQQSLVEIEQAMNKLEAKYVE